jgi:CheY-like chemotaxis protein
MMMPEMNGVEFLQIIRAYLRWASIPVVVVTGYPDGPHMDKAQQLEVRHVFRKADYKIADLVTCVAGLARDPNYGRSGGIGA